MFKKICINFVLLGGVFMGTVTLAQAATTTTTTTSTSTSTSMASTSVTTTTLVASNTPVMIHDAVAIEKRVREFFADAPVMIEIARCESKFRQFTDNGNVVRGGGSTGMVGIFQFYEVIHKAPALALGFDINTVEGNLGYAKHLYQQSGTRPWASCVPDVIPAASATAVMSAASKELQIKLLTKVVELLHELLKLELAKRK